MRPLLDHELLIGAVWFFVARILSDWSAIVLAAVKGFQYLIGWDGLLSGHGIGKCSEVKKEVTGCLIKFQNTLELNIVFGMEVLRLRLSCGIWDNQGQKKWMKHHESGNFYFLHWYTPKLWNVCLLNEWHEAGAGLCISILFAYFSLGYLLWWLNWPLHLPYFYSFKPKARIFIMSNVCVCVCMHMCV